MPPVIATGPATRPRFAGGDPEGVVGASVLPLTVMLRGVAVRNPNAAGAAVVNVLASGLLA